MNTHFRQLVVASSFAFAAGGALAQYSSPTPSTATPSSKPRIESMGQVERDYEAAKASCQNDRVKADRLECLRRAEDAYNKAVGVPGAALGGKGGSSSGTMSGAGSNSAKQRS